MYLDRLCDLLEQLNNEINSLRTYLTHSGDTIGREVGSGACSAPQSKAVAGHDTVLCYQRGDRLNHPSIKMTRGQADERDRLIADASQQLADDMLRARIVENTAAVIKAARGKK